MRTPRTMSRRPVNLSVDPDALERARRYADLHHTSLSQLVTDYFASLPFDADEEPARTPGVRRLLGIARGDADLEDYRDHLLAKYER